MYADEQAVPTNQTAPDGVLGQSYGPSPQALLRVEVATGEPGRQVAKTVTARRRVCRSVAALAVSLLLLTGCGKEDASDPPLSAPGTAVTESPTVDESTSSAQVDASQTPFATPTPERTRKPYQIPQPFNLLLVQTGGRYRDHDGYTAEARIFLNTPVIAHKSDMEKLSAICPDSDFAGRVREAGLTLEGGLIQTFDFVYDSPSKQFPFPLQEYLSQQENSGLGARMPSLFFTGTDPSYRPQVVCASSESDSTGEYVGFAALLPLAKATPNNPDRKLPICSPELALYDPLYSAHTSDLSNGWADWPRTAYGPYDIGLSFGWKFSVDQSVLQGHCQSG